MEDRAGRTGHRSDRLRRIRTRAENRRDRRWAYKGSPLRDRTRQLFLSARLEKVMASKPKRPRLPLADDYEGYKRHLDTTTDRGALIPGRFYWVIPANDPDEENALTAEQPALFAGYEDGEERWLCIGIEGVSDWPMKWVGHLIR
jgi:hypothetical protein